MPEVGDVDFIKNATFMSLSSPATNDGSKSLVKTLIAIIKSTETRKKARQAKVEQQFEKVVGLILGDLLLAYDEGNRVKGEKSNNGLCYHSMSPNSFSDTDVGYIMFRDIVNALESLGYISIYEGRSARPIDLGEGSGQIFHGGFARRFKAKQTLIYEAQKHGLKEGSFHEAFSANMPTKVLEVRASKIEGSKRGKKMKFTPSDLTEQLSADVTELNHFLSSFRYEGMVFSGLRRLFNEGDREDFNFNLGGRLYCANGQGYIGMKSEDRANILIDGENIVEVDINASYLTILHALKGETMPDKDDVYEIDGLPREVVKKWFSITMGASGFQKRWLTGNLDELKDAGVRHEPWMTVKAVEKIVLDHFPIMQDWPKQEVRWSNLMFIESEVIVGTMLALMRQHSVPSLPVHDCLIVKKSDQDLAVEVLTEQFQSKVGIKPRLKIKGAGFGSGIASPTG